ncbi:MAG: LuxR C-terminal-related transcriptional regulator [Oscillospiraceae bacterium]
MERNYLPGITGYVHRPRVQALFEESLASPLVLVIAAPGYGKTLSAAHFFKRAPLLLVWVRISGHGGEVAGFWEAFVQAAARELPEYAQKLHDIGFPSTSATFELFRQCTEAQAQGGKKLAFVLDNYERLSDARILRFLQEFIEADLSNVSLYILCNAKLPFADMFPPRGQYRITDEDLAFTREEAAMMLERGGQDTTPLSVERVLAETGGWPLGLSLVCTAHRKSGEARAVKTFPQLAAELFEQHYFKVYPRAVQNQLIRFALLPRFSLEMVVGQGSAPGDVLYDLLRLHPFVINDYGSDMYVFQTKYHDFLKKKQAWISQESKQALFARAGRWFLDHDMISEAMDCLWEAADYDGLLNAVAKLPKIRRPISMTNRILHRLEQIPRSYADKDPRVDFSIAFMYLNAAEVQQAKALLHAVAERLGVAPTGEESRLLLGEVYATLADIATYQNEDEGLGWMQKAHRLLPQGSRAHSPQVLAQGNNSVFFLPKAEGARLEYMLEYMGTYAHYAEKVLNGNGYGVEYQFAGEAAYFREDMDKAAAMFNSAMLKGQQMAQHDIICNALWGLVRIEFYYANYKTAFALLSEIITYIGEKDLVPLYELRDSAIAWFYLRLDDAEKVPAWFSHVMTGPEELPVDLGRNRLLCADYLHHLGEEAKAYALLLQLEAALESKGRWHEKCTLYILKARHLLATGEDAAFEAAFSQVYRRVYMDDLKLVLAEHGKDMMAIISHIKKLQLPGYDMAWLDAVWHDALSYAKRLQTMQRAYQGEAYGQAPSKLTLTPRENETLRYLAQGLTQQEVGKLMGISGNAVKKHVAKIYQKLGAVNRADAIHIASITGLVDILHA